MRILVYGSNFAPELTGIGKYTGEMVQWLVGRGHQVRVVAAPPYYPQWRVFEGYSGLRWKTETIDGVTVYRNPIWVPRKPSAVKRLIHVLTFALSSWPTLLRLAPWRPDLVVAIEPPLLCAPGALLLARICRSRAWLHVQDFEVDAAFELGLLRKGKLQKVATGFERWAMQCFDRVSTISSKMVERLLAKGVSAKNSLLFPNWVDTEQVFPMGLPSPLRNELGVGGDECLVLYSGNMGEKQGLEIVIDAARELAGERAVRFVLCGEGAAVARLRELTRGAPNVGWFPLQPVGRLNELLSAADIHLLPQRADAADLVMPSKLTGIFASGRPVVATAHSGTEVWNAVQGRGIAVEPGNVQAFSGAILRLAGDAELRKKLGAAGREYAVAELDKEKILARFEAELVRLVEEG